QPGQQRRAVAGRTGGTRQVAVRGQTFLVGREPLPRDVCRQAVTDEDQALLGATDQLPGVRPTRLLLAWVRRPVPEPRGPGVARLTQQVLQRRPVRPAPLQLPLVRAAGHADRDTDLVMNQVAE